MEHLQKFGLLDANGKLFGANIEGVLNRLLPRLRREFPVLQDEVAQVEILEEAGRRLVNRESRTGPIERINGYAWVTIRSIAMSRLRQGRGRILQRTLGAEASETVLSRAAAIDGSADQIEQSLLLREVLALLTRDERRVCLWKFMGFSSQEIARRRGSTVSAVDMLFFHAKQKIRRTLGVQHSERKQTAPAPLSEQPDGETEPTS